MGDFADTPGDCDGGLAGHGYGYEAGKVASEEEEETSQRNRALTRWAKLREQGYSRYLLLHGVLGHGMPLAGLLILAALFFGIRGRLLVTVGFVGAVGGLGSGMGTWTFYERQYLRESHRRGFDVLPPKE